MSDANKAALRRFFEEVVSGNNLDLVDELVTPDFVWHGPGGKEVRGAAGLKQLVGTYLSAFPGMQLSVEDQVAESDKVVTRFTARGTHTGELEGVAPSGKSVTIAALSVCRLEGGKYAEVWEVFDELALLQQIGAVQSPAQA